MIRIKKLSSGYFHIRGQGPCNWAQPARWPCGEKEFRESCFPQASEEFILSALKLMTGGPKVASLNSLPIIR